MKTKLLIHPKFLKAVNKFASKDETRFILQGVCVDIEENGKVLITATEGRMLLSLDITQDSILEDKEIKRFIIPSYLISAMPKTGGLDLTLEATDTEVSLTGMWKIETNKMEGNYPNWKLVIPQGDPTPVDNFSINIEMLSTFYSASRLLGQDPIRFQQFGKDGPFKVIRAKDSRWTGVLMPIHSRSF